MILKPKLGVSDVTWAISQSCRRKQHNTTQAEVLTLLCLGIFSHNYISTSTFDVCVSTLMWELSGKRDSAKWGLKQSLHRIVRFDNGQEVKGQEDLQTWKWVFLFLIFSHGLWRIEHAYSLKIASTNEDIFPLPYLSVAAKNEKVVILQLG